jgi:hypothetical protein
MGILQVDGRPVWTVHDIARTFNVSRPTVDNWLFKASNFPAVAHIVGQKQRLFFADEVAGWHSVMIGRRNRITTLRSKVATLSDAEFAKVLMLLDHKASVRPPAKSRVASKVASKK